MDPLTLIGYWHGDRAPGWPDPVDFVDTEWDADEREGVFMYLRRGLLARAFLGPSSCRFCQAKVGNLELTDGYYIWPEGLAHYVWEHSVRLPPEFVQHVARMERARDDLRIDETWWRGQVKLRN
jgi:hypothetical protein